MKGNRPVPGGISWVDLTVENAPGVRDFYRQVVGWKSVPVPMEGYDDYAMVPRGAREMIAGVCHARGVNADLPPVWLLYITVASLKRSISACRRAGGSVVAPPRGMGKGKMCVVRDPAGAMVALYEAEGRSRR